MSSSRNRVTGENLFGLVVDNDDLWVEIFLVFDDDRSLEASSVIDFGFHRDAWNHVAEFNFASLLGENWHIVRIPLDEGFAFFDMSAVSDRNR